MPRIISVLFSAVLLVSLLGGCEKKPGLRITGIEPKTGPVEGSGQVIIKGSGFQADGVKGVKVYFGDKVARVVNFIGDEELVVEPPPGALNATVDVTLIFDDARQLVYENAFTYVDASKGFSVDELAPNQDDE